MIMRFLEYIKSYDYKDDEMFTFHPIGTHKEIYDTIITIDWLNMDMQERGMLVGEECNCGEFRHMKRECKHIKMAKHLLENDGYKFRKEIKLIRYYCPVCKVNKFAPEGGQKCKCGYPMMSDE